MDADGRTIQKWIKTRADDNSADYVRALLEVFEKYEGRAELTPAPEYSNSDLLTTYPIADLHVGLYSWAPESGEDYDLKLVESLFIGKMNDLFHKSSQSETAILLNLGDYFHSDSRANRTEQSGNVLDVDSRYARVLTIGIKLQQQAIELALQKHQNVIVRNLAGNHDYHTSLALTAAMGAWFRNEPRIVVDDNPSKFWFYQHGKTMLAATHGDMAKPEQMAGLIAATKPQMWGETRFRYGHSGHVHHRSLRASEGNGMYWETHQTIAAKDFWHASMGYCSGRSLCSITYHKEFGEWDRVTESVPPPLLTGDLPMGDRMTNLVAFCGRIGAGKSTAARLLVEQYGFRLVKFADPLKDMLRALGMTEAEIEGDRKEVSCKLLGGRTPRYAMQTLGTEWGRDLISPDLWVNSWIKRAKTIMSDGGKVVVDDLRFPNEEEIIRRLGGNIVEIHDARPCQADTGKSHCSEGMPISPDARIFNYHDGKWRLRDDLELLLLISRGKQHLFA